MNIFFNKLKNIVILNLLIFNLLPIISYSQSGTAIDSMVRAKAANYIKPNVSILGKLNVTSDFNLDFSNKDIFSNYKLQSSLQANIYGITMPLSFSYSNGRTTYGYGLNPIRLPSFNRIGLSPKYQDYTLHIGYRQLQYTKYTLSNIQFKGIGIEYQPNNLYFSLMKGVLKPAISEDDLDASLLEPSFRRNTWALKTGIEKEDLSLGMAFISIKDDPNSLKNYEQFQRSIHPRENAVIGLYLRKSILKNLNFNLDYAFSGLSYDIVDDPFLDISTQYTAYNYFGLFTTRNNSIYDKAYNSSILYNFKKFTLALKYERVDPDFRSMGAFFFNNNFITRTGSLGGQALKDKLQFTLEIGNESKAESDPTLERPSRLIGSTSIKYKLTDHLSVNTKYSNMNDASYVRKPSLQSNLIDSLLQTQTKEKINFSSTYIFGKNKNQSINLSLGYQRGLVVDQDQFITSRVSKIKNSGITYSIASDKYSQSYSYNLASISNHTGDIITHSFVHSLSIAASEHTNIFANTSISMMNSDLTKNVIFQNEMGIDKNYLRLHKIKSSIGTQIGRNNTNENINQIFLIIFKISYDIAFRYRK